MSNIFFLPVHYKDKDIELQTELLHIGFTHRFKVNIEGQEIYFEPDEEGNYRVTLQPGQDEKVLSKIDKSLLVEISGNLSFLASK